MTEEESEVFEITDFTTASEWERFIAKLEEVLHDWKSTSLPLSDSLSKEEITNGSWEEQSEAVVFADFTFVLTRHQLKPAKADLTDQDNNDDSCENKKEESKQDLCPPCWQDMMSKENDFPARAHCLSRWFGLREFCVLTPSANMEDIMTESRGKMVLSSIAVAIHNTACSLPMFVQLHQRWRRLYAGECQLSGLQTSFEMVHLKHTPHQYNHLSGLLDVFKSKLTCPLPSLPPVSVAVRFTYVLQDWAHYTWPQQPPDMDSLSDGEVGVIEYTELPFGACEDPVSELHLSCTWPSLSEEMIVENDVYSDLDPLQAPHWFVKTRMTESPLCLLGDYLQRFVSICKRHESTDQLLGRYMMDEDDPFELDAGQALSRLTEPVPYKLPSIGNVVTKATTKLQVKPDEAPIPAELLSQILTFLFPDAKYEDIKKSTTSTSVACEDGGSKMDVDDTMSSSASQSDILNQLTSDASNQTLDLMKQFKSAPSDSLTFRLAVCLCIINYSRGLKAVAHLWQEFVLEMRYRLENNHTIPDLQAGSPDMGCSLIHQKLQMLNCCIERKQARDALLAETLARGEQVLRELSQSNTDISETEADDKPAETPSDHDDDDDNDDKDDDDDEDDEFFECDDVNSDLTERASKRSRTGSQGSSTIDNTDKLTSVTPPRTPIKSSSSRTQMEGSLDDSFTDSWTHQAEGRLRAYEDLRLLNIDEVLYVPITQEPAPMTEDLLEEHAEVLAKLGTSAEGAHLRARMQSACLLSDMEAFKSANPGCALADFVRWYSPRDWIEQEVDLDGKTSKKGQLSQRMQIPGNMWVEVWQSAKPVPARRQRRLFDDTKEAEKVLHWLSSMKPAELAQRLLPMVLHAAIHKLTQQEESQLSSVRRLLGQVTSRATKVMRQPKVELRRFEELVGSVGHVEVMITRAQSLITKLSQEKQDLNVTQNDLNSFVSTLLDKPEVNIIGAARAPLGVIIHRLFMSSLKSSYLLPEEDTEEEGDKMTSSIKSTEFPAPVGREYILRSTLPRPAPWSRPTPHRMYCVLLKDELRLAGAFSADTTFQ